MKCDDALKYIYLSKETNPDAKKNIDFEEHLKTCANCQKEFAAASQYFNLVSLLQNKELQIEDSESITGNVIGAIRNLPHKSYSKPALNRLDIIYSPLFRYAAAIILLLTGLFYFSEEITAFQNIRGLENKFRAASAKRFNEIKYASVDQTIINPLTDIYNLVNEEGKYIKHPGDWILIRESEILRRIKEYKSSSGTNLTEVDYKEELKRFFGNPKIQTLMNQNEELKNLFDRVFPEGVDNHE